MQIPRRLGNSSTTSGNPEKETEGSLLSQANLFPKFHSCLRSLKTLSEDQCLWGHVKVLCLDCDGGYTTTCISKNLHNYRLNRVNITVNKLHLNLKNQQQKNSINISIS